MTDADPMQVSSSEHGVVRIFTTELDPEGAAAITAGNVERLLGEKVLLDASKVEVFPAKVLADMGLTAYLAEGHGIAEAGLEGKRAALDALTGLIIVIPSSAFAGSEVTLAPNDALRFVGAFREPAMAPPVPMAKSAVAEGRLSPKGSKVTQTRQRRGSWIIALGALIIAAALVLFAVF